MMTTIRRRRRYDDDDDDDDDDEIHVAIPAIRWSLPEGLGGGGFPAARNKKKPIAGKLGYNHTSIGRSEQI
jgi:hypothetical protein